MKHWIFYFPLVIVMILSACGVLSCTKSSSAEFKWKMLTSWTEDNLLYSKGAIAICNRVDQLSNGRLVIEPYPAGKLAHAFEVFDAVSSGQVEIGHSWPGYWREKDPSFELFSSIPNNMVQQEWPIWLYGPSNGIVLWQKLYAKYNLIPFPGALGGPEFGYFTTMPLRTLDDFEGLRIRSVGMAADVLKELGATPLVIPQDEIIDALKQGRIDAFEFGSPAIDWGIGFDINITPYVTLPPWHQPSSMYETFVNEDAWNKLPADLKDIFEAACKEISMVDFPAYVEGVNADYQKKYEQGGMQVFILDTATMQRISDITDDLVDAQAVKNAFYAEVLKSQRDFTADYRTWEKWSDPRVYQSATTLVIVDESSSGRRVEISLGSSLQVVLDSNHTTGFSWELTKIDDPTLLEKVSNTYETPQSNTQEGSPPIVGAKGKEIWNFKTLKKGTSTLSMEYSQPWAGGIKGARKFDLTVIVK